jgi:multidrug efflux pump subunit AcrA (membrane-fusion protein)
VSLRLPVRARLQPNGGGAANAGSMAGAAAAAVPGPALAGQVVHISPVIDPRTGQGRVRLLFPGAGQRCRPGTLVRVELVGR